MNKKSRKQPKSSYRGTYKRKQANKVTAWTNRIQYINWLLSNVKLSFARIDTLTRERDMLAGLLANH